jgi:putative inorganic carbon (HCO3(-)) transporter
MKIGHSSQPVESHLITATIGRLRRAAAFLTGLEIWIVGGAIAVSVVYPRFLSVAVGVAAAYWPIRWVGTARLSRRTPVDWAVFLLILMIPVTLWATALPEVTTPQILRLLTGIALYYTIVNWSFTESRLRLLVAGFILVGLGLALAAPFSVQWFTTEKLAFIPTSIYDHFNILVSDTIHPNLLGGFLAIFLPVGLALLVFNWRGFSKLFIGGILIILSIMIGFLILTKSRGGWLAFGAVLVLLSILRWRRGWLALAATGVGSAVAIYFIGLIPLLNAFSSSEAISGIDGRIEIWSRAIYMIQDFPFTGIGMGSFMQVADTLYPFFLMGPGTIIHAHNLFLQIALDLGLPGLIAWLAIFLLVIIAAWQVHKLGKVEHNGWVAGLGAGLLGSQLALTIHGLTDAVTWGLVRPAPLVWAFWGLAIASWYVYVFAENKSPDTRQINRD